ncbi:arginine deiminase type-3 [Metarhizium rileyi]|uniref:Arginine deiminase type-3 n=1 Tax=Metarhizium rileyi (strain RCEF 4871) TaxID=1649241 RepID=A0A166Y8X8_METRR|nr:arginine deiminase type-3 [Metarhizium rileyi RCEF 4871]
MYYSLGKTAVLALVAAATTHAFKGIILADTNRDGRVDVTGNTDFEGKANWTEKRGALFLPNIVDTGRRCSSQITDDTTESGLAVCNDASDNILRQPQYLAPLRTLPIPNLNSSVTGTITLSNQCARDKVRVFRKDGGKWIYVGRTHVFNASALRPGLELGIDGRDVRRPNEWDGRVTVTFQLTENRQTISSDAVTLRVAPILTHHHLQAAKRVFTVAGTKALGIFEPAQQQFADFIGNYTVKAGIKEPVHMFKHRDIWAQDYFEPGYASIPGPKGPVYLRVNIRSSQPGRDAGRMIFSQLRSDSVGAVQYFTCNTPNRLTTDSTGNLEAIPPYSYKGKDYPAGRAVMGRHDNVSPTIMAFLKAQEAQYPIDELDHDWLLVGHTDEYMQFLPANNPRGWVMTLADPERGMSLLKNAQANGHGKQRAMSRTPKSYDPKGSCLPTIDIDGVLGLPDFEAINKHCADRIKYNMDIIKRETGLTESEIVRVPSLFYHPNQGLSCNSARASRHRAGRNVESEEPMEYEEAAGGSDEPSRFEAPKSRFLALFPETVNGVVYPRGQYMAPNPWGPIIGGKDIIADAVSKAYATVGFNATFMDDWFDHHVQHGETHCGSNTARDASQKWW